MIDLALDPSDTRDNRNPAAPPRRALDLRIVLFGLAGIGVLGGFGVAASTLMAGLASPPPMKFTAAPGRAQDWPDLKDGLPALAGTVASAPPEAKPAEPVAQAPRMASLPDTFTPAAAPSKAPVAPTAKAADASVPPTRRIPTPTQVSPLAASRQVVPLPPSRTAALQTPRASETVRARVLTEPAPKPVAASAPAEKAAKPTPKVVATKPTPPTKTAEKAKRTAPTAVAQAEPAESEETEVLGIKLPSLAPAGRKLKESVDAIGDAVKSVF
ncbi:MULTISPECIES: hypothetical protein [unclassified Methylobacterium]|uniref:hypothetical protein n=1 Tax=unclassified Methylobacterium TaxID=2615210 RepID=UPI00226AD415|nr:MULTISPECIES: hypothetical protein [unclassified Methylobacterium]